MVLPRLAILLQGGYAMIREELKVLARQHSNEDELQRFAMFFLLMYP